MAIEYDEVVERGGAELIRFLHFCVYSMEMAPVFVFLAREYRFRPTVRGALALYDNFCAADAPARVKADSIHAPRGGRLDQLISRLQQEKQLFEETKKAYDPEAAIGMTGDDRRLPPAPSALLFLFDRVVERLRDDLAGPLYIAGRAFDPSREPMENLPGGRLNTAQRSFLDNVWRPRVRPQLVAAGFWRAANLGQ